MASGLIEQILKSLGGGSDDSGDTVSLPGDINQELAGPTRVSRIPTIRSGEERETNRTGALSHIIGEAVKQSVVRQILRSVLGSGGMGKPNFVLTGTSENRLYRKGLPKGGGGPEEFDYY